MKLYLIERTVGQKKYDDWNAWIVAAKSKTEALLVHPAPYIKDLLDQPFDKWAKITYIGRAASRIRKPQVILDSFNAG